MSQDEQQTENLASQTQTAATEVKAGSVDSALDIQSDAERVQRIDELLSHVWMVRTFLKHSEEAEEDDELSEVHRTLYDYMLALGGPLKEGDHLKYLKQAKKKLKKLENATELFLEIQPEISSHTNFQMAALSLKLAVAQVAILVRGK